jgi:aspartyl-tRNA(Asn)/glutamyl-tRNA(Gln) amidotransferase subunit C
MNKELLQNLMQISRLDLPEAEQATMLHDLAEMEAWIHKLQEVDTTGVAPLAMISEEQPAMREDTPAPPLDHTNALANAFKRDSNYFRVPKVKN